MTPTRHLLWDQGPGEVRLAITVGGSIADFRVIRPRHPEQALMAAGEHYTARITARGAGGVLATLGFGDDVLVRPAAGLAEGARVAVAMTRPPIPEPGRWKRALVRPTGEAPDAQPGWRFSGEPWEHALREFAADADAIIVADAAAAQNVAALLGPAAPTVRIAPGALDDADFDAIVDGAAETEHRFNGGALSIERTRAMTMIDVDGEGDAHRVNLAAASEIGRLIRLFDIGGPVGIDFVSMADRAARHSIDAALAAACVPLGQHERTAINGFGFAQIIRPRARLSLPEILCGTHPGRLTVESLAVALLREAARSQGVGTRRLVAAPAVVAFLADRSHEIAALQSALGAPVMLVGDPAQRGYGHVHVIPA